MTDWERLAIDAEKRCFKAEYERDKAVEQRDDFCERWKTAERRESAADSLRREQVNFTLEAAKECERLREALEGIIDDVEESDIENIDERLIQTRALLNEKGGE